MNDRPAPIKNIFYRDGRPTRLGRVVNGFMAWYSGLGLPPRFQSALEVLRRTSGRVQTVPVVIATVDGDRYLVSMLGRGSEWVKNVEASGGEAVLRHGGREPVRLVPVDDTAQRAPVLKEYCRIAPGGRRHFPIEKDAPLSEYEAIAERYPVFRIGRALPL